MAFRFRRSDSTATRAFRRVARDRFDHAIAALEGAAPPETALHSARTDIKKLRALIALARPGFADWEAENAALRDAARRVSALRDRTAMLECFDRLIAPGDTRFAALRSRLAAAGARPDAAPLIAGLTAELRAARARATHWHLHRKGFAAFAPGLARNHDRARKAMARARESGAAEDFHDWRKRAKALWYHAALFAPIRPGKLKPYRDTVKDLGETLGEIQDIANFATLPDLDALDPDTRAALDVLVAAERARLEARVFALGAEVLDEKTRRLTKRWRRWWKDWRG